MVWPDPWKEGLGSFSADCLHWHYAGSGALALPCVSERNSCFNSTHEQKILKPLGGYERPLELGNVLSLLLLRMEIFLLFWFSQITLKKNYFFDLKDNWVQNFVAFCHHQQEPAAGPTVSLASPPPHGRGAQGEHAESQCRALLRAALSPEGFAFWEKHFYFKMFVTPYWGYTGL